MKQTKEYKLYANTEYMEYLVKRFLEKGQLWTWMNLGYNNKKAIWRIK